MPTWACMSKIAPIAANVNARCSELPSPKTSYKASSTQNNARSISFWRRQLYNTKSGCMQRSCISNGTGRAIVPFSENYFAYCSSNRALASVIQQALCRSANPQKAETAGELYVKSLIKFKILLCINKKHTCIFVTLFLHIISFKKHKFTSIITQITCIFTPNMSQMMLIYNCVYYYCVNNLKDHWMDHFLVLGS